MPAILHYLYTPYNSWSYGISPLIDNALSIPGLKLKLHGGINPGEPLIRQITANDRHHILTQDRFIAESTGQVFSDDYKNGLLDNPKTRLNTPFTIAAILAAMEVAGLGYSFLQKIQTAHYIDGRATNDINVLLDLVDEMPDIDTLQFATAFDQQRGQAVKEHMQTTRQLQSLLHIETLPGLVLAVNSKTKVLQHSLFYNNPENFKKHVLSLWRMLHNA